MSISVDDVEALRSILSSLPRHQPEQVSKQEANRLGRQRAGRRPAPRLQRGRFRASHVREGRRHQGTQAEELPPPVPQEAARARQGEHSAVEWGEDACIITDRLVQH